MKHVSVVALALAGALVAGCGGGNSVTGVPVTDDSVTLEAYSELERQVLAMEQAQREAEAADREAQQRADGRVAEANEQLEMERAERAEAEERTDDIEEALGTADQIAQANTRDVFAGLDAHLNGNPISVHDVKISGSYPENPILTVYGPIVTFHEPSTSEVESEHGDWLKTAFSNHHHVQKRHEEVDSTNRIDVYTDAEPPVSVPFATMYSKEVENIVPRYDPTWDPAAPPTTPTKVIDGSQVVGSILLAGDFTDDQMDNRTPGDRDDADAKDFPKPGEPTKVFAQTDRGAGRDTARYPLRYTAEVEGKLGGAEGMFTCASSTAETDGCRVTNQAAHFHFVGPWVFTPSSADATTEADDGDFMYFGWWARQAREDLSSGEWGFQTFHGPLETEEDGNRSAAAEIQPLTGTATYRGLAAGLYAFYQPLSQQSEHGEFRAVATFTADFGTTTEWGTVQGTIDQFEDHPDWTLTLGPSIIKTNGNVPDTETDDTVFWSIEGEAVAAPGSGQWNAAFYSNLPPHLRNIGNNEAAMPTGMAGEFEAEYHHVGRIVGAFGTHLEGRTR